MTEAETSNENGDAELGFTRLGARIGSWSSRLIVCGLIVVVSVTFGRQVLIWWGHRGDAASPQVENVVHEDRVGQPFVPQWIQFGESPIAVQTQRLRGQRKDVLERLTQFGRRVLQQAEPLQQELGDAERKLLQWIDKQKPVGTVGDGRLFSSPGPLPMVVAVRPNGNKTIDSPVRVVSWGIGLPSADSDAEWMLYTYSAHRAQSPVDGDSLLIVPRLAGSRRILTLRDPSGSGLFVLAGNGTLASWQAELERVLEEQQWQRATKWRELGKYWIVQFAKSGGGKLTVQLAQPAESSMQAVLNLHRPQATSKNSHKK